MTTVEIVSQAPLGMEIASMSTADLRRQLNDAIGLTETAIVRVATIWVELTRRGEDLSNVKFALAPFLAGVAQGRVRPRLVVTMGGQPRSLARLADLPVADQDALLNGRQLDIYKSDGPVKKRLPDMTLSEVALTIRDGAIRSLAEQRIEAERPAQRRRKSVVGRPAAITVDGDVMTVGKIRVPVERVISALRQAGLIEGDQS